jgi:hypothetical protein
MIGYFYAGAATRKSPNHIRIFQSRRAVLRRVLSSFATDDSLPTRH